ncbi:uncharacterized protein LOC122853436 isoform X2 [Aphidius gifuensis]|uniref:uncharacterized protein LOC122853436 isoform X2 n=1 Tax=Aphidius gifuensis TaxID=684658 RepID=UPI001CDD0806|nr:uncharacterized protein LOC122853436 isoform X2 [Aphidius gifuensis]
MLTRSSSSRCRKASRNAGVNSPQGNSINVRRASVATDKIINTTTDNINIMDRQRSPRGSVVPNIAFNADDNDEPIGRRILPDPEMCTTRGLLPEQNRSPRNSLIPDEYCRSPRGSLVPDTGRIHRDSLLPDVPRSPRHSLVPNHHHHHHQEHHVSYNNRSPRNSIVPGTSGGGGLNQRLTSDNNNNNSSTRGSRHSLFPEASRSPRGSIANIEFDKSPRGSICPDVSRSPRGSIVPPNDYDKSPRGSICPEMLTRSPRGSIAPGCIDIERSSITSEYHNQSPRGSIMPEINKSPRGSIIPDTNRSPRGSICPEGSRSPRGSLVPHDSGGVNRSPRGSVAVLDFDKNPRGSIVEQDVVSSRSPRGSIGPDIDRSPRGSLGGHEKRYHQANSLTFHEPRRASADQGTSGNRSNSPYRQREVNSANVRSGASCNAQTNFGYGTTNAWADSRRASSSVSQFSGDESRRLCMRSVNSTQKGVDGSGSIAVATYGSLVFQLKDAHREANGTCDFVFRAMRVVSKTMIVTICLACLSTMPVIMLIMGLQYIKDCPKEPHIPVYMIVGGTLGGVRMFWALYSQIRSRRLELLSVPTDSPYISPMQLVSIILTCFLTGWFVLGNYWILKIRWPDYEAKMFEPDHWCHKTLYTFSIIHLGIMYAAIGVSIITAIVLAICRFLACPWFERYK